MSVTMTQGEYNDLRDRVDALGKEMRQSFSTAAGENHALNQLITKILFIGGNGGGPHGIYARLDELERRQESAYVAEEQKRQRETEAQRDIKKMLLALGIEVAKTTLGIAAALVSAKGFGWL